MGNSAHSVYDIAVLALCSPDAARRNAEIAARNGRKATELSPEIAKAWRALGWANYCMGKFHETIAALEKSCTLQEGGKGDAGQWIVLALAHGKLALRPGNDDRDAQTARERNSAATTSRPAKKSTCGGHPGQATSWIRGSGISARKQRKCCGSWKRRNSKQPTRSQRQSHCACKPGSIVILKDLKRERPVGF